MVYPGVRFRFVWPMVLVSLGLIALCGVMAVFLLRQQAGIADVMGENIESNRAVADLGESLIDLAGLLGNRVEGVSTLHERIKKHLTRIMDFADHDEEQRLAGKLSDSFRAYLVLWRQVPPRPGPDHNRAVRAALTHLESETLHLYQELREHNHRRIEQGSEDHRRILRELAWGMAGVGGTGGVAGLLLGYLMARALEQSIRRLQVQVRDAAGKLAGQTPEVVVAVQGEGLDGLQGQMRAVVVQIEEVVDRLRQREREVLRAEQLAAVGQLAAGVAHEIRNPLTAIKMLVQAGREDGPGGLPPDDLQVIEGEVRRMEKSLDIFLSFARPARPERHDQDLAELARRTLDLVRGRAERQRVALQLRGPAGPLVAPVDGEQIHQVLVNLCLNALDAMPAGGILQVSLGVAGPGLAEVRVLDSGPGIPGETLARLFEPFFSTKETGLGLGLVISRRIAEDHGGTLTAANSAEGGGCMTVRLPLSDVRGADDAGRMGPNRPR